MPKAKSKSNTQGTISKFFTSRAEGGKTEGSNSGAAAASDIENGGNCDDKRIDCDTRNGNTRPVKTVNYPKTKTQKRSASDNDRSAKRQKLNSTDGEANTSKATQSLDISLSDDTKQKLDSFILDPEAEREKTTDEITIEDLKRPNARHITVEYTESLSSHNNNSSSQSQEDRDSADEGSPSSAASFSAPKANMMIKGKLSKFGAAQKSAGVKIKPKYTPLEQQVVQLKEKYPDAILFIECGYKYRFFGDDAEIAAKELNIFAHLDHSFMTVSIPVHRLYVHVRRLVSKGYKVGVVRQTETAALKAAGDNRNTPFTRQLSALYTSTTLIGEDVDPVCSAGGDALPGQGSQARLMCIYEPDLTSRNKAHQVAIVSIQPSTGEFIYDVFTDLPTRSELEMRVAHIQPAELLLPCSLTPQTEKVIRQLTAFSCRKEDRLRIERISDDEFEPVAAYKGVSNFYGESPTLAEILTLPKPAFSCINALITYLNDFNLQNALKLSSNMQKFTVQADYMLLPATTIRNLEIFHNLTDGRLRGSLLWVLNQTATRFGSRLLRNWIAKPLLDVSKIEGRLEAITELLTTDSVIITQLRDLLPQLPDLEKGLATIFHKRCSTQEFMAVCQSLVSVLDMVSSHQHRIASDLHSSLLRDLVADIPDLLDGVLDWIKAINEKAAKEGDKTELFIDVSFYPEVQQCKSDIEAVLADLDNHRKDIAKTLGLMAFSYKTIMGTEFLIDVKNSDVKRVPKDWIKINGSFEEVYPRYKKAVERLATLDCLFSLTTVARQDGFCRPVIKGWESSEINIVSGRHPVVDALLGEQEQYVPNDTCLEACGKRCRVITGPNMGGKSSYIKQVALLTMMAQIGSYVPAQAATIGIVDAIFTRMGASDELFAGRSTFMVELQEASEVMTQATSRSLVILDELGRGTSTHDGVAIAYATLKYFIEEVGCMTLFVTHYPPLGEIERLYPDNVSNHHMSFLIHEEEENADKGTSSTSESIEDNNTSAEEITFLYQLVEGAAGRSYGLNVARLAGISDDIIKTASVKSQILEDAVCRTRNELQLLSKLWEASQRDIPTILKDIQTN